MRRAYSIPTSALRNVSEWKSVLETLAALGFDTLELAPLDGDVFAHEVCPALDLAKLAALAGERSLKIILGVRISSAPAASRLARMLGLTESEMGARDPRVAPAERRSLPIPFSDEAKAENLDQRAETEVAGTSSARRLWLLLSPRP